MRPGIAMRTTTIGETITLDDLERDPYPIYERLRDDEPVSWVPAVGLWLVTRWEDVHFVDTNPEVFTAATEPSTLNRTFGLNMLGMEGKHQRWIRRVVEPSFRPRSVEERMRGMLLELAGELIDGLVDRGACDLLTEFADPLAERSLLAMLGLEEIPWKELSRWNEAILPGLANFEGDHDKQAPADEASAELGEAIGVVVDRVERKPDASVLSTMVHTWVDDRRMTRDEAIANAKLMFVGGVHLPRDLIGLVVWALLEHGLYATVRGDPALAKAAVEETLRCYSPVGTSTRQTTRETELAGVALPTGSLVAAVASSANRDPRRFTDPDRFDIHRREGAHLAFATGSHFCLGAWLSRYQARTSVDVIVGRLPGLRLDAQYPIDIRGWEFRVPASLHVRWD